MADFERARRAITQNGLSKSGGKGNARFEKDDRFFGNSHVGFSSVIVKVQADTNEFSDLPHTGANTRAPFNQGQARGIDLAQTL